MYVGGLVECAAVEWARGREGKQPMACVGIAK